MPLISVILTSFDCAAFIGDAIDSLLAQTLGDFELLISDDASTDGSRDIIAAYARRDARIVPFCQATNLGLVGNYNFLLDRVRGEFVAIQDADDWSDPARFERLAAILEDPAFVLAGSGAVLHYPDGTAVPSGGPSRTIDGAFDAFPWLPASIMFRSSLLKDVPHWPDYFAGGTSMDRYFIMDLLDGRRGYHLGEPLYHARVRAGSNHRAWSPRKLTTHQLFLELQRQRRATGTDWLRQGDTAAMAAYERRIAGDRRLVAAALRESGVIDVDCGNYRRAARLLARSLCTDPLAALTWRSALYLARKLLAPGRRRPLLPPPARLHSTARRSPP